MIRAGTILIALAFVPLGFTVWSMLRAFHDASAQESAQAEALADGIADALLYTAVGTPLLIVAGIVCIVIGLSRAKHNRVVAAP